MTVQIYSQKIISERIAELYAEIERVQADAFDEINTLTQLLVHVVRDGNGIVIKTANGWQIVSRWEIRDAVDDTIFVAISEQGHATLSINSNGLYTSSSRNPFGGDGLILWEYETDYRPPIDLNREDLAPYYDAIDAYMGAGYADKVTDEIINRFRASA